MIPEKLHVRFILKRKWLTTLYKILATIKWENYRFGRYWRNPVLVGKENIYKKYENAKAEGKEIYYLDELCYVNFPRD